MEVDSDSSNMVVFITGRLISVSFMDRLTDWLDDMDEGSSRQLIIMIWCYKPVDNTLEQ